MNRIQLACTGLIVSSLILTGLLLVQLDRKLPANQAQADQVIAQQNFTLMTADTREDEQSLFILDNNSATLLIYGVDMGQKRLEPLGGIRLEQVFRGGGSGGGRSR
jgi:hypothetical protein